MGMPKSLHSREYDHFLSILRHFRENSGITQEELAAKMGQTQTFVSKCERGERRVDVVELRVFCKALKMPLQKFINAFESGL